MRNQNHIKLHNRDLNLTNGHSTLPNNGNAVVADGDNPWNSLPWSLIRALHTGNEAAITNILENAAGDEAFLYHGAIEAWAGSWFVANTILKQAAHKLCGMMRGLAHLTLAESFINQGKLTDANYYIARAISSINKNESAIFSGLLAYTEARADILRGELESANDNINQLLHWNIPFFEGCGYYLSGCLLRYKSDNHLAIGPLEKSLRIFQAEPNLYFTALASLELSKCSVPTDQAFNYAKSAEKLLRQLGKAHEADAAFGHLKFINEDRWQTKSCLFISPRMRAIRDQLDTIASSSAPVLIYGELGTGKEAMACSIHEISNRRSEPLVIVNCADINETLADSQLFGYEKGSFTGALAAKIGYFEEAGKGTIFLDEIGDLPLSVQPKLLRVVENRTFRRLGGTRDHVLQARILCATNRNLEVMVEQGTFRADLLSRLASVYRIELPPLRDRIEEVLPLAEEFLKRLDAAQLHFDKNAADYLLDRVYHWNIRELRALVERAVGCAKSLNSTTITVSMFAGDWIAKTDTTPIATSIDQLPTLEEALMDCERNLLIQALTLSNGNVERAAQALGMKSRTFYRRLEVLGIENNPAQLDGQTILKG